MWAPGSYKNDGQRTTAPAPNIGIERYFFEAGEKILRRIKDSRGTVILPERTGPIADVLYSAAGNSADDGWYRKGIIAYSFETGADRILNTTTGTTGTSVGFQPVLRRGRHGRRPGCLQLQPGQRGSRRGARVRGRQLRPRRVRVRLRHGHHAAADDARPPDGVTQSMDPINYRFTMDNEASVIHYTTDGSTPTLASPTYEAQRARGVGQVLDDLHPRHHHRQVARDSGHQGQPVSAVQTEVLPARPDRLRPITVEHRRRAPSTPRASPVPLTFSCADEAGGSGAAASGGCVGSTASPVSNLPTGTAGMQALTITAAGQSVGNVTAKTASTTASWTRPTRNGAALGGTVPAPPSASRSAPRAAVRARSRPASTATTSRGHDGRPWSPPPATRPSASSDPSSTNTGQARQRRVRAGSTPLSRLGDHRRRHRRRGVRARSAAPPLPTTPRDLGSAPVSNDARHRRVQAVDASRTEALPSRAPAPRP